MNVTAPTTTESVASQTRPGTSGQRRGYVAAGLAAAVVAAVVTTALAALALAVGVDFEGSDGEQIPFLAFPQLTLGASLLGVALAALVRRWSRRPATTFVRIAVALTALSLLAPIVPGVDLTSALVMVLLHLVAAAIVVPVVARRLAD